MMNSNSPLAESRRRFLAMDWLRYPACPPGCVDATLGKTGLIAGRLSDHDGQANPLEPGEWALCSGAVAIRFRFARQCEWLPPQKGTFEESLLATNDLLCIHIDATAQVRQVLLLAPSNVNFKLASQYSFGTAVAWMTFVQQVRDFFQNRNFLAAQTPTLVPSPGTEPYLEGFSTEWSADVGLPRDAQTFYLPTSPEFHLKKLLVAGYPRVFEIKNCFRNGEISNHHQPEFTMLEWYRAYANLDDIAADASELLLALGAPQLERTTMRQLFAQTKQFNGFQLTAETSRRDLDELAISVGTRTAPDDTWDEIFFRLFLEHIEPELGLERPLLVQGYPASQAALARIGADGFAERFEIYWKGLELANAFHELNDPEENQARFDKDVSEKKRLGRRVVPVDRELMLAIGHGLPPSGGIALGLDRLFMALHDIKSIADSRAFPLLRFPC